MVYNQNTYHLIYDTIGSLRRIVDDAGTIIGEITYDSFGNVQSSKMPLESAFLGFAGGDTNLYGYVLGDPVNFVDPYGLKSSGYTQGGGISFFVGIAGGSGNMFFAEVNGDNGLEVGTFLEICLGLGLGICGDIGTNTGVCQVDNRLNDLAGLSIGIGGGVAYGLEGLSGDVQIGAHSISGNSDLGAFPGTGLGAHVGIKGCYTIRLD